MSHCPEDRALSPDEALASDLRSIHGSLRHPFAVAQAHRPSVALRIRLAAKVIEKAIEEVAAKKSKAATAAAEGDTRP